MGHGPVQQARQLVGTWEGGNAVAGAASASGLVLRADGTYSGSSSGTVSATSAQGTATTSASGRQAGRWSLSGWTLTLTSPAGRLTQGVAYSIEQDDKPAR